MKTLEQLKAVVAPERKMVVCRELTKMFEQVIRGSIDEVLKQVSAESRGEFVVVIGK